VETEVRRRGRATEREKRREKRERREREEREKRERREREEREMEKQPYYQRTSQYDPEMGYGKTEEEGGYATYMEKQVSKKGLSPFCCWVVIPTVGGTRTDSFRRSLVFSFVLFVDAFRSGTGSSERFSASWRFSSL